jgi:tetratricopeptide (TPR) repeat protein
LDKEKLLHIYSCKDYKERKSLCDKFFESLKNGGDVVVLVNSGIVKFHIGELNEAKKDLEKAKNIIESFDDNLKKVHKITRGYCLQWLGIIQRTYGNLEEAETLHKKAKKIAIDVGDKLLEAHAHANLGAVVLWRDGYKPSEVLQFWNEAFRNSKIANDTYWQIHFGIDVEYMKFLDVKYQPENQHKRLYNNSLNELITWIRLAWRNGYKEHIARGIMNQGNVMFALEDYNESERLYKDALEKAKEIGANRLIWRTNHNIGNVYRKQGYNNAAKNKYEDAIEDLKREVEKESEKVKTIHDKKDPLRSMLILTLDLDKKEEAIKKAQDYKKVFAVDFLTDDEKDIDLNKLKKEALVQFDCKVH